MASKNAQGRTRDANKPYEIWQAGNWEWRVLKKWQGPEAEAKNPYARWFCQVITPMTGPRGNLGDVYVRDITSNAVCTFRETEVSA